MVTEGIQLLHKEWRVCMTTLNNDAKLLANIHSKL